MYEMDDAAAAAAAAANRAQVVKNPNVQSWHGPGQEPDIIEFKNSTSYCRSIVVLRTLR